MDNILIARKAFRYAGGGSERLMTDGRKALLPQSGRSFCTGSNRPTPLEFSSRHLHGMSASIMGFKRFDTVRVRDTASSAPDRRFWIRHLQTWIGFCPNSAAGYLFFRPNHSKRQPER